MRILLADHHPKTLLALKTVLQEKEAFEVCGEVTNATELLALASSNPPDLVLIDWELPGLAIKELICELYSYDPRPVVVVFGSQPEQVRTMLKAGADAAFSKVDQPDLLLETLQKFAQAEKPADSHKYKKEN